MAILVDIFFVFGLTLVVYFITDTLFLIAVSAQHHPYSPKKGPRKTTSSTLSTPPKYKNIRGLKKPQATVHVQFSRSTQVDVVGGVGGGDHLVSQVVDQSLSVPGRHGIVENTFDEIPQRVGVVEDGENAEISQSVELVEEGERVELMEDGENAKNPQRVEVVEDGENDEISQRVELAEIPERVELMEDGENAKIQQRVEVVEDGENDCDLENVGDEENKNEEEGWLDEWEGIESTELDRRFGAAVVFVGSKTNAARLLGIDSNVNMELYALQKVAMEGPCIKPPPVALKVFDRAKWNAWKQLEDMSREKAMEEYIALLSRAIPDWMEDGTTNAGISAPCFAEHDLVGGKKVLKLIGRTIARISAPSFYRS